MVIPTAKEETASCA